MQTLIYIAIYVLGCVLAYGRFKAEQKEGRELYGRNSITNFNLMDVLQILFSWICFVGSVISYFKFKDKYFLVFRDRKNGK